MRDPIRTYVSLKSNAFNTTEPREYYINPSCFGDDLAKWLLVKLSERSIRTVGEPGQEDFGWYVSFQLDDQWYDFVIGYRPGDDSSEGCWIGWLERKAGLLGSLLGARRRGIEPEACEVIHAVLSAASEIADIRWHFERDFRTGRDDLGAGSPRAVDDR
jgi:hypothetical protein